MAKDPNPKKPGPKKGDDFADLYKKDVEFGEEDFVEEEGDVLEEAAIVEDWDEDDDDEKPAKGKTKPAEKPQGPSAVGKLRESCKGGK